MPAVGKTQSFRLVFLTSFEISIVIQLDRLRPSDSATFRALSLSSASILKLIIFVLAIAVPCAQGICVVYTL